MLINHHQSRSINIIHHASLTINIHQVIINDDRSSIGSNQIIHYSWWIINYQSSISMKHQSSTTSHRQSSFMNHRPWITIIKKALNNNRSPIIINHQSWAINHHSPTINHHSSSHLYLPGIFIHNIHGTKSHRWTMIGWSFAPLTSYFNAKSCIGWIQSLETNPEDPINGEQVDEKHLRCHQMFHVDIVFV